MIYGTFDDLDKLAAYIREIHPKMHGKPHGTAELDPVYEALKSYYTRGKEVLNRRRDGFQHQHIIDQKDLAELYIKPGAKIMPLNGDAAAFIRTQHELDAIYKQLPCVTLPIDRHQGKRSLSSLAALNRQHDDLKQLRLTYSEIYGEILEPKQAREVRSVLKEFVRFVSESQ